PMSGALRWTSQAGGQFRAPAVAGLIYAASNVQPFTQGDLRAIDSHSSNQVWDVTLPGLTLSTPAVANGVVYLGCSDHLRAFDGATGAQLWQDPVVGAFDSSPAVSDGVVYASASDGTVYAFGLP